MHVPNTHLPGLQASIPCLMPLLVILLFVHLHHVVLAPLCSKAANLVLDNNI